MVRGLRALIASGLLVFAIAVPALANTLNQTPPIAWNDAGFQGVDDECDGTVVADGEVLWHFVHTMTDGSDLPSTLTVTFSDASEQTVDGYSNGGENAQVMYDVTMVQGVSLTGAEDTIVNGGLLNLSHICAGGPPPEVPEAPVALLLPLMALFVLGGYLLIQRRRSTSVI